MVEPSAFVSVGDANGGARRNAFVVPGGSRLPTCTDGFEVTTSSNAASVWTAASPSAAFLQHRPNTPA
jgi:hypothetical protein